MLVNSKQIHAWALAVEVRLLMESAARKGGHFSVNKYRERETVDEVLASGVGAFLRWLVLEQKEGRHREELPPLVGPVSDGHWQGGGRKSATQSGAGYRGRRVVTRAKRPAGRKTPKPGMAGPRSAGRLQQAIDHAVDATVRREIIAALKQTGGNVVHAARALGISQPSMYGRMAAVGIDPTKYRK
jgi:DNA-binding NtrC family response regulator